MVPGDQMDVFMNRGGEDIFRDAAEHNVISSGFLGIKSGGCFRGPVRQVLLFGSENDDADGLGRLNRVAAAREFCEEAADLFEVPQDIHRASLACRAEDFKVGRRYVDPFRFRAGSYTCAEEQAAEKIPQFQEETFQLKTENDISQFGSALAIRG
jgi:hypothetical protein